MQKVDFDIDKKHVLGDIISRQTGSLNKAIKELFQNSFDAQATEISITINKSGLRFVDNGVGMNKKEIFDYFRVFGNSAKRNDPNQTGEFAIGRGQFFNFGKVLWRTHQYNMVIDIKKSLDFLFHENNKPTKFVEGTDIIISFYKQIYSWDVSNILYTIKSNVLPPKNVKILIDGKHYKPEIKEFEDFSTSDYFVFTSNHHISRIYNGNLEVRKIYPSSYSYSIMPYHKLKLNFARNELIENEESTDRLIDFIFDIEEKMLIKKKSFQLDEAKTVISLLFKGKFKKDSFYDKKIIPLSNDKLVSFKEIKEKPNMGVVFGDKNVWSDDCLRNDYIVISKELKPLINTIISNYNLDIEILDKNTKDLSKRGYYKETTLNSLEKNLMYFYIAIELNEFMFEKLEEKPRDIRLGLSDLAQAWTKPYKKLIFLNRSYIESLNSREEAIISLWETLCHEYSHTDSNTQQDYHNYSFYENFEEKISKTVKKLPSALKLITRKYIKEKYGC